ncbi:MAG: hypothetical protein JW829_01315 [Pirellulales bacterium]|nr:hypothetical protein [Pirellulales bacterium]
MPVGSRSEVDGRVPIIGLDIGGANLKIADGCGYVRSMAFALWREPWRLSERLRELIDEAPKSERIAVTMTGELCDCYATKAEGVRHILAALIEVAAGREVEVYLTDGRIVPCQEALQNPMAAAASNWHALAAYACRYIGKDPGLLIDIGSTTSDLIPLAAGKPVPQATDDTSRLIAGELVYSGIGRTPVPAVVNTVRWRGQDCPVAAEYFTSTLDVYVILGELPEDASDTATADGKPRLREYARARLARSVCMDPAAFSQTDGRAIALAVREAHTFQLVRAAKKVIDAMPSSPAAVVLSGAGEFLARRLVDIVLPGTRLISFSELLGSAVSCCAPAHALAQLANERKLG